MDFYFFLLIGFTALYFFWETPFWFYDFVTHVGERLTKIQFSESHKSMFQFFNYYRSDEISFLRAFFDGMVSNLICIFIIIGIVIFFIIGIVILLILLLGYLFNLLCVYLIIIQIFAYFNLNSKLHRFLSNGEKFAVKLSVGIIISLLLTLLSIYIGIVYCETFDHKDTPFGYYITTLILPFLTYLLLQFFLRNTAFAKKSRNGVDQWSKSGLNILLLPLIFFAPFTPLFNKYGLDAKETESSEKI